jgi:hypothetical protein
MSKKLFFFDFSKAELPNINVWGIVALPIRLLGRVAIDSGPKAQMCRPETVDVMGERKSISRHSSN